MKLNSYCVYNFRSVEDSGWIECSDTTTLVGVNESGKTNILKAEAKQLKQFLQEQFLLMTKLKQSLHFWLKKIQK